MKGYLITLKNCGPCKRAVAALEAAQPLYAQAMDIIDSEDPFAKQFAVMSYPTFVVYDEAAEKEIVRVSGSDNLNEEFWGKALIVTKTATTNDAPSESV